jgi:hypothetical protein
MLLVGRSTTHLWIQKEKVDEVIENIRVAGGDQRNLDDVAEKLKDGTILQTQSNTDHGLIAIELSFGRKYDVYRDYDKDGLERPPVTGNKDDAIRWTDQVMDGWKKAISRKDPNLSVRDVPLNHIIRSNVFNDDTNNVIEAAMQKAGQKFGDRAKDEDYIVFAKNDENKEGFEAIAGTDHGKRVIQMLKEYVSPIQIRSRINILLTSFASYHQDLGKTVDAFLIKRSPGNPDPGKPYSHDILIELADLP